MALIAAYREVDEVDKWTKWKGQSRDQEYTATLKILWVFTPNMRYTNDFVWIELGYFSLRIFWLKILNHSLTEA